MAGRRTTKRGSSRSAPAPSDEASKRERTTVLLPADVLKQLRLRAVMENTEMSLIMEAALREYLGKK